MTIAPTSAIIADFCGGSSNTTAMDVVMMIGVGLQKESDAVFFQYLGDEQKPSALMMPSGKPVYNFRNVQLVGIDIAEEIGEFKSTKLNVYLQAAESDNTILVTSGLTTLWSQAVVTSFMGLFNSYDLSTPFTLNSWKGTSKMRPCFASVKIGETKITDDMMYNQLGDARGDRDYKKVETIMRDAVSILKHAINPQAVDVKVDEPAALPENIDF